jgi:hypothetical protein
MGHQVISDGADYATRLEIMRRKEDQEEEIGSGVGF